MDKVLILVAGPTASGKTALAIRLAQELGVNPDEIEIDMGSLKAGLGVEESVNSLTYRELQQRRDLINKRMRDHIRA